jgi:hypothetical protein
MNIYPPPKPLCDCGGLTREELLSRHWALYADVKCVECGKEQALSNTVNGKCCQCGGEVK